MATVTCTIVLSRGRKIRVTAGWQHIYSETHYRVSARQATGLGASDVPVGVVLHVGAGDDTDCPHCSAVVHRVISGTMNAAS
jgi:hypothetical protein